MYNLILFRVKTGYLYVQQKITFSQKANIHVLMIDQYNTLWVLGAQYLSSKCLSSVAGHHRSNASCHVWPRIHPAVGNGNWTSDLSQTIFLCQLVAPCVFYPCVWVLCPPQGHFVTSQLVLSESCRAMWRCKGHPHHRRQHPHCRPPTALFTLSTRLLTGL